MGPRPSHSRPMPRAGPAYSENLRKQKSNLFQEMNVLRKEVSKTTNGQKTRQIMTILGQTTDNRLPFL